METPSLIGIEELSSAFRRLDASMERRTSRRMVAAAGGILRTEARGIAAQAGLRKTGALIRNIAIKRDRSPKGVTQYNLGVRHGRNLMGAAKKSARLVVLGSGRIAKRYDNDPWYWVILHGGAAAHEIRPQGKGLTIGENVRTRVRHPGIQPTPFISMAMDRKRQAALDEMQRVLLADLDKETR